MTARKPCLVSLTHANISSHTALTIATEEWHHYLLTLGLSPILDLASACAKDAASGFVAAKQHGWIDWNQPLSGGSRSIFLKEAVSRLYEERVYATFASTESHTTNESNRRERRKRSATFARDLQQRRRANSENLLSSSSSSPAATAVVASPAAAVAGKKQRVARKAAPPALLVAAASVHSQFSFCRSTVSHHSLIFSPYPASASTPVVPQIPASALSPSSVHSEPTIASPIHPAFRATTTTTTVESVTLAPTLAPTRYAPVEEAASSNASTESLGIAASLQHPLQWELHMAGDGTGTLPSGGMNSADRAVFRIVEMGFSPEQAKTALRITDMGDGLRVDRAVEFLLRTMED